MADRLRVTWEVDDGYGGGSRPQHITFHPAHIETDASESDLRALFDEAIRERLMEMGWFSDDEEKFLAWARAVQAEQREEEGRG